MGVILLEAIPERGLEVQALTFHLFVAATTARHT